MMMPKEKMVYWSIWFIGILSIAIPWFFCHKHVHNFLFATLYSSISFAGLAVYAKTVLESKEISSYHRNIKFSGIIGAFVLTASFAIVAFSSQIDSFTPASFFWILSFGTMFIGFVLGGLVYVVIAKLKKRGNQGG